MRGLYIHIPFCRQKCLYCDFYSSAYDGQLAKQYAAAVIRNITAYGGSYDSVYFGGGTPVLMAEKLGDMLAAAEVASGAEITAECNPCEMTDRALCAMREAGINRISIGVQSFCDNELSALGRRHDSSTAVSAVKAARAHGFDNISLDLMLGIPQQTADSLRHTLDITESLGVQHVSAYMLKIEQSTPFGKNTPPLPDDDETADMYLLTDAALEKAGLLRYEISNFARRGYECQHNLKYWRCEEYLGIGPAAHSFTDGRRFAVPRDTEQFISQPRQTEHTTEQTVNAAEERIMLSLRLREGIPEALYKPLLPALRTIPPHLYTISDGRLSLTAEGTLVSNSIIAKLLEFI